MHKFSQKVKLELAHIVSPRACCTKAELSAIFKCDGSFDKAGNRFDLMTELPAVARKILNSMGSPIKSDIPDSYLSDLKKKIAAKRIQIDNELVHKKKTELRFPLEGPILQVLEEIGYLDHLLEPVPGISKRIIRKRCCRSAYLRGLTMACGYVSDPAGSYHFELNVPDYTLAHDIRELLEQIGVSSRIQSRARNYSVYVKRADMILKILSAIEAYDAFLQYENSRMFKEMKGTANRQVNCDTYNLNRILDAANRQIEAIKWLEENDILGGLSESLIEIARLRIENPEADIEELGRSAEPPLTKQAAYHRLTRLMNVYKQRSVAGARI